MAFIFNTLLLRHPAEINIPVQPFRKLVLHRNPRKPLKITAGKRVVPTVTGGLFYWVRRWINSFRNVLTILLWLTFDRRTRMVLWGDSAATFKYRWIFLFYRYHIWNIFINVFIRKKIVWIVLCTGYVRIKATNFRF